MLELVRACLQSAALQAGATGAGSDNCQAHMLALQAHCCCTQSLAGTVQCRRVAKPDHPVSHPQCLPCCRRCWTPCVCLSVPVSRAVLQEVLHLAFAPVNPSQPCCAAGGARPGPWAWQSQSATHNACRAAGGAAPGVCTCQSQSAMLCCRRCKTWRVCLSVPVNRAVLQEVLHLAFAPDNPSQPCCAAGGAAPGVCTCQSQSALLCCRRC